MFVIFTSAEVAEICGVSVQSINNRIRKFTEEQRQLYLVFSETSLKPTESKKRYISSDGLEYFKALYADKSKSKEEPKINSNSSSADSEVIAILKEQIRIKDEQIAMLMEQNRNFQVLLHKAEEVKALPEVKKSFLSRLFGRKE